MRCSGFLIAWVIIGSWSPVLADGPKDNQAANVRSIPPLGAEIADTDRADLQQGLDALSQMIQDLKKKPANDPFIADIEIFHKAVRYGLDYRELYVEKKRDDVKTAKKLLDDGMKRAEQLAKGEHPWTTQTGLVVRGYRSKIDDSVQPYGLVIPKDYQFDGSMKHRLDFWWHGRGETITEVEFIRQRQTQAGQFTPASAIMVHPYGRYCNANKFAGEVDSFEVLDHVKQNYRIDEDRIVARGFSMGGAACWQYATHYPTLWAAAAPGAGFAETPEFLDIFQKEKLEPTWYEKKLWGLYNATDYSVNLYNLPTVAYSGEIDKQKQAADVMARELLKNGIELTHIIGPKTGHAYEKTAKMEVDRRIDSIVEKGRTKYPPSLLFQTNTLRYNKSGWIEILGMGKHWEPATVKAEFVKPSLLTVQTSNVTALRIHFEPGYLPFESFRYQVQISPKDLVPGGVIKLPKLASDKSFTMTFGDLPVGLKKEPGLQGPIDDAFLDRFIMVQPTGDAYTAKTAEWVQAEMAHAIKHWRQQFRGDAIIKKDTEITEDDIANANLILWGDPQSNAVIKKIAGKLPISWVRGAKEVDGEKVPTYQVQMGPERYTLDHHVPVMIYPNPLNPKKYIVLNSGFTYREYDYLNNARQVPKLPDYAMIDIRTPADSRYPGKIVRAGFFDEMWELQANDNQ